MSLLHNVVWEERGGQLGGLENGGDSVASARIPQGHSHVWRSVLPGAQLHWEWGSPPQLVWHADWVPREHPTFYDLDSKVLQCLFAISACPTKCNGRGPRHYLLRGRVTVSHETRKRNMWNGRSFCGHLGKHNLPHTALYMLFDYLHFFNH